MKSPAVIVLLSCLFFGCAFGFQATRPNNVSWRNTACSATPSAQTEARPEIVPTLELLTKWTEDYLNSVESNGGLIKGVDSIQNWFDDEFVETGAEIGPINKKDFCDSLRKFREDGLDPVIAIPDLTGVRDGYHIDPHDPWRIWVVIRYTGTHTNTLKTKDLELKPKTDSPTVVYGGPEMYSFLWTPEKKIKWLSVGYVGCRYTGTNRGFGGVPGLLVPLGISAFALDFLKPAFPFLNWLTQFQEDGRAVSPDSELPQWWRDRKKLGLNIKV